MNNSKRIDQIQTDRELLHRFRQLRDRDAFGEIVQRYGLVVFGVCQRVLRHHQSAEDAFQQTFLSLARHAQDIQKPEALPGWLYATARRSALANASAREPTRPLPAELAVNNRDPLSEITARELILAIDEELAALSEEYRSAILLCGIEGLTVDEAAERLGTTNGSLRGWLQRGREQLKKRLARRGLELPTALGVAFGLPANVSAQTVKSTIESAVMATALKPMIWSNLLSILSSKPISFLGAIALAFIGWKIYHAVPKPEPKIELPPVVVGKWELGTDTPLPLGAIARIGDGRHTLNLGSKVIRFSEGGSKLVALGKNELVAWDVTTGEKLHHTPIEDLPGDVSPDGKWFAQLGNIYDALTGKKIWQAFEDDVNFGRPVAVHFVGYNRVAMTFHTHAKPKVTIRLIDVEDKSLMESTFAGFRAKVLPGGDRVAVWDRQADDYDGILVTDDLPEGTIRIHSQIDPEAEPVILSGFRGEPFSLETDSAGKRAFALTPDGRLSCWDTTTGKRIYSAAFKIPQANSSRAISEGKTLRYISEHSNYPKFLAVSPNGDKAILQSENSVIIDCHSIGLRKISWSITVNSSGVRSIQFDEANERIIARDSEFHIWNSNTGECLSPRISKYATRSSGHDFNRSFAISPDGRLIAFSKSTIGIYETEKILDEKAAATNTPETLWQSDRANSVSFVAGSNDVVWVKNAKLAVYDIDRKKTLDETDIDSWDCWQVRKSKPDQSADWIRSMNNHKKWSDYSWSNGNLVRSDWPVSENFDFDNMGKYRFDDTRHYYPHGRTVYRSEIASGQLPVTTISRWEPISGEKKWAVEIAADPTFVTTQSSTSDGVTSYPELGVTRLIAAKEGKRILVIKKTRAYLLDAETGKEIGRLSSGYTKEKPIEFDSATMTPDGTQVALGVMIGGMDKCEVRFYRIDNLDAEPYVLDFGRLGSRATPGPTIRFGLSPDGKLLATCHGDGGLKVFDIASRKVLYRLPQVTYSSGYSFSADNRRLIAEETNQHTALIWDLEKFAVKN